MMSVPPGEEEVPLSVEEELLTVTLYRVGSSIARYRRRVFFSGGTFRKEPPGTRGNFLAIRLPFY